MSSPANLEFIDWFEMIRLFQDESDRGAAVLMAGFVDNYLALYLQSLVDDKKVSEALFSATGPLSSFSQRITIAYAFDFIGRLNYEDLNIVRRIRNHFAHHPLEASFVKPEVVKLVRKLSTYEHNKGARRPEDADTAVHRNAYAHACSIICTSLLSSQNERRWAKEDAARLAGKRPTSSRTGDA